MKNKIIIIVGSILITGCVEPYFNPSNKEIQFVQGKAYYIPKNVIHLTGKVDKSDIKYFRKYKVPCKIGDAMWFVKNAHQFMKEGNADNNVRVIAEYAKYGKAGCIHPLSTQEYQYRLNQDNQDAANSRTSSENFQSYQNTQSKINAYKSQQLLNSITY